MAAAKSTLQIYWQEVKKHRTSFFIALICIPLSSLCINALLSYFFSQSIGQLLTNNTELVVQYLIIASLVGLLGFGLNFIGFRALVHHESKVITILRNSVFEKLINKDFRFFVDEKIGALTSKYIDFVRSLFALETLLIIRTVGLILSLVVGLILIGLQSWIISGVLLVLMVAILIEVRWSLKVREPYRQARKELRSEIHGKVADCLTNNMAVKTFVGEGREIKETARLGAKFTDAYFKDMGFLGTEGSFRILSLIVVQVIAISISASLVIQGEVSVATVIFSLTYLQLVGSQIFSVGELLNGYEDALLDAAPLTDILNVETKVKDAPGAAKLDSITPTIQLDNVSYRYDDNSSDVLSNIDLFIPAGQKIGLVGYSGAGKTTMTHLLLRFSDVSAGRILIDGQNIAEVTQSSLRHNIAYVPQEATLFHRSLKENIAYGKPDATDDEIIRAARQANALGFIETLPNGFDTLVGERGIKLSGGQRQRVAIARAILKDAPILILDEATSALDSESEKLIQEALTKLMKNRTSIVIAHRLSTIAKLDRIIVLDDGKIIEEGSHADLLAAKGRYARLWSHQSGGFIKE